MKGPLSQLFSVLFVGVFVLQGCSSNSKDRGDVRPDEFTVTSTQTEVEPNTLVESQPFTVTGINREAKVTLFSDEIADLKFTVNGGEPKESGSTVRNGDEVVVLGTSPSAYGASASINVNIGGVESEFAVSTGDDQTPPEVSILFPPPSSMTEGETVFVRGTVEDLYGEVSTLLVNGVEVDITEGLPEWSAEVSLNEGENTLTVTATDVSGNENNDHSVNVRMDPEGGPFPDNENPSSAIGFSGDFAVLDGEEVYVVPDFDSPQILSIDLTTGARTVLLEDEAESLRPLQRAWHLISESGKTYVSDLYTVFQVDLLDGTKSVLLDRESAGLSSWPRGLELVMLDGEEKLLVSVAEKIYWLDFEQTDLNLFVSGRAGEIFPEGGVAFENVRSLHKGKVDPDQLLIVTAQKLLSADLQAGTIVELFVHEGTGFVDFDIMENGDVFLLAAESSSAYVGLLPRGKEELIPVSNADTPNGYNALESPSGIDCQTESGYCIIVDTGTNSLYAMDRSTGHRVVLTRSVQE